MKSCFWLQQNLHCQVIVLEHLSQCHDSITDRIHPWASLLLENNITLKICFKPYGLLLVYPRAILVTLLQSHLQYGSDLCTTPDYGARKSFSGSEFELSGMHMGPNNI